MIRLAKLRQRDFFDFGFERLGFDLAALSLIASIAWLIRSRNIYSWACSVVSLSMTVPLGSSA
jgi:hypothetical protein